jgi:ketosteroid isomerase-like protein
MTSSLLSLCVGALAVVASAAPHAQDVKSDQQVLMELERAWDAAFHKQDAKFIETLLAEEFIATYGDGTRGDKSKELSLALDTSQQVDSSRLDEFIIKIFGNTAVVWFTQHLVGPVKGKPTEVTYRYVDVWVNRSGRWLAVASQSTRVNLKE